MRIPKESQKNPRPAPPLKWLLAFSEMVATFSRALLDFLMSLIVGVVMATTQREQGGRSVAKSRHLIGASARYAPTSVSFCHFSKCYRALNICSRPLKFTTVVTNDLGSKPTNLEIFPKIISRRFGSCKNSDFTSFHHFLNNYCALNICAKSLQFIGDVANILVNQWDFFENLFSLFYAILSASKKLFRASTAPFWRSLEIDHAVTIYSKLFKFTTDVAGNVIFPHNFFQNFSSIFTAGFQQFQNGTFGSGRQFHYGDHDANRFDQI